MQQSNASNFNILSLGGGAEFKQNVASILGSINTGELVEVTAVEDVGVSSVGFVSVKILTLRTNADNNNVELGEIHNVPYFRLQGGKNAVIIDPQVGDIGYCGFCSRDISIVKRIRAMAAQNMSRISDVSDAVYFGGWGSVAPEQYVWFDGDDIKLKAKSKVIIDAPLTEVENDLLVKGKIDSVGAITSQTSVSDPKGSIERMRSQYNTHNHIEQGDGQPTTSPNTPMD